MKPKFIGDKKELELKKGEIVKILLRPEGPGSRRPASRVEGFVPFECKNPINNKVVTFEGAYRLIADALENFSIDKKWNFKQDVGYPPSFEFLYFNQTQKEKNIYIKISVKDGVRLVDFNDEVFTGMMVKIWSFHPARK